MPPRRKHFKPDSNEFPDFRSLLDYTYGRQPPQITPMDIKPREIKHVVWDADDTIWQISPWGLATSFHPPFKKIDKDTLEGTENLLLLRDKQQKPLMEKRPAILQLKPGFIETLDRLQQQGISSSIASTNQPGSIEPILEALNIREKFDRVKVDFRSKDALVEEIIKETGVPGEKILFIDDTPSNVFEVVAKKGVLGLRMDWDITRPEDVLGFIKEP